jgi:opacity protein-like surface antigen
MGFQRSKTGEFAFGMNSIAVRVTTFFRTAIVILLGFALGACAFNPKTGQWRLSPREDAKPGERWFSPFDLTDLYFGARYDPVTGAIECPECGEWRGGYVREGGNPFLIPVQRWTYGISVGGVWGTGDMNHFFPAANTNSRISDFVATGTFEYSRSIGYDPALMMDKWVRFGIDVRTPVSGDSRPNFGGEVLQSRIGWMFTPKVGASVQFLDKNGKTSGLIPINHCLWMTGGLSIADVKDTFADESHSKTAVGWTLGAGMDINYTHDWTARIAVEYTDLGRNTIDLPGGPVRIDHTDWSLKVGLFRRFESYAPTPGFNAVR